MPRMETPEEVLTYAATCAEIIGLHDWTFTLSKRCTRALGLCYPGHKRITFSLHFVKLCLPGPSPYLRETVLHELGHALAHTSPDYKCRRIHDSEWRRACADIGLENALTGTVLPYSISKALSMRRKRKRRMEFIGEDEHGLHYMYRRSPLVTVYITRKRKAPKSQDGPS